MGLWLKQSTTVTLQIGPFVDSGDGDTDEDGFTIAQADVLLSKNGGVYDTKHDANNAVYDTAGFYRCQIDDTDTNTLGRLQIDAHVTGALHVYHEFMVVPANVWDSFFGADVLHTDLTAAAVDTVWDELMAGHVTPDSAAYVMRSLTSLISAVSLAQAGAAGSITLAAASSAVNDFYKGQTICIVLGTGAGQARACYAYNGGTKVASIRPEWATAPDNTSYYAILNVGSSVVAAIEDIDLSATMKASVQTAVEASDLSGSTVGTVNTISAGGIDGIWDEVIEGTLTGRQTLRLNLAVLAGKSSGGGTATLIFRDSGDGTDRVTATVDANGNRTGMVLDVS